MFGKRVRARFPRLWIMVSVIEKFKVPILLQTIVFLHFFLKDKSLDPILPIATVVPCFIFVTTFFYILTFHDMLEIGKEDPMVKLQTKNMDEHHKRWFYNSAAMEAYDLWFRKYKSREDRYLTSARLCTYTMICMQFIASFF